MREGRSLGNVTVVVVTPVDVDAVFHGLFLLAVQGVSHVDHVGWLHLTRLFLEVHNHPARTREDVMRTIGTGELPTMSGQEALQLCECEIVLRFIAIQFFQELFFPPHDSNSERKFVHVNILNDNISKRVSPWILDLLVSVSSPGSVAMARRVRIEYPGPIYHVLSRGNYRKDLFTVHKSGQAFEKALFETCRKWGWVIADNKQKKDLAKALLQPTEATVRGERDPRDVRQVVWEQRLEHELSERAKTND
jgi:hypothetical protein